MREFIDRIRYYFKVSDHSISQLLNKMTEIEIDKYHEIISKGENNDDVYFVKEGLTRSYVLRHGKDYTIWFSKPGEPVVMTIGTVALQQSSVYVEALEKSTLLKIKRNDLEMLFTTNLDLCNWGRRLADSYLIELEAVLTIDLCATATERYERLIKEAPDLLQRVPLKYLASYLLVTPESLSRIRRNLGK